MICERVSAASNICTHTIRKKMQKMRQQGAHSPKRPLQFYPSLYGAICAINNCGHKIPPGRPQEAAGSAGSTEASRARALLEPFKWAKGICGRPFWIIAIFNFNVNLRDTREPTWCVFCLCQRHRRKSPLTIHQVERSESETVSVCDFFCELPHPPAAGARR
jgi:hypothetical protein